MACSGIKPLHLKVTQAYVREAWEEKTETWEGRTPLAEISKDENILWWGAANSEPAAKRKKRVNDTKQTRTSQIMGGLPCPRNGHGLEELYEELQ